MRLAPGKNPRLWATLAGLLVVALPVLLALRLASLQSQYQQERQAARLAAEVLHRSDEISRQIGRAQLALTLPTLKPCSALHLQLMARMTAENPLIVAFGYIRNDRLLCSTFGHHGTGLPIGAPDYRSRRDWDIRAARPLPGITSTPLLMSTEPVSGYTAIIHPDSALNFLTSDPHISLGVYNTASKQTIAQRGSFDRDWAGHLEGKSDVQFFDGKHIVALQHVLI